MTTPAVPVAKQGGSPETRDAPPERFRDEDLTRDAFLGGRVILRQPRVGYRAATDPVLLAAACAATHGQRVLDLGCGAGAAALCLAARVDGLEIHGLELQPRYAALARSNAAHAGVALTVHEGDVARPPAALRARMFDHVVANPPFFPAHGACAPDAGRDAARREGAAALATWIDCGLRRLRQGGWITLIHRAERLPEMLGALAGRAGDVALLPIQARAGREAGRVLLRARKDSRAPFRLLAPLVMHVGPAHLKDGDDFAPEALAVLRDGAALRL
ncbi:tRNA1(Val) A37 N6-methylase TrmN6 [Rubrimonas cliftonensis]|uniref:tRNA1(Val) A37 N6-methylase TrmN6 n=1 Tax=Rubrimonas cliftonensis TaxID=89524 RepID=A0A1H3Z5S0_9RHOB|nr:tRNA1(Val) A37 N6-methylase TrmN6 [Rubrimonas cliftonensis]